VDEGHIVHGICRGEAAQEDGRVKAAKGAPKQQRRLFLIDFLSFFASKRSLSSFHPVKRPNLLQQLPDSKV
jgi:hypothetical protein